MKKGSLVLAALLALCTVLAACSPSPAAPSGSPVPSASEAPAAAQTPSPTEGPLPSPTPDVEAVRGDVEAMMPILDSLVRTMGSRGTIPYAPRDGEFFWYVLYLIGENWGQTHPLVQRGEDGSVTVPRQVMQEFASAAFLDYDDLLPLPESMESSVRYDEGLDAYLLAPSDMGSTDTRLDGLSVQGDALVVRVGLYEGEDFLGALEFTLVENPYADGISDPIYLYTIRGAAAAEPN